MLKWGGAFTYDNESEKDNDKDCFCQCRAELESRRCRSFDPSEKWQGEKGGKGTNGWAKFGCLNSAHGDVYKRWPFPLFFFFPFLSLSFPFFFLLHPSFFYLYIYPFTDSIDTMAAAILPSSTISTSSIYPSKASAAPGIKLAPLIRQATVVSYERRQGKMWFIIHVDPQQLNNATTGLKRHSYTIARRYDDCVQFCQRLYDAFPCLSNNTMNGRAGPRTIQQQQCMYDLPKLKPQGLLNKKQSNGQRRAELDRFVQALFRLPAAITHGLIVLEFFGLQKSDTEQQVLRDKQNLVRQQQAIVDSTANHQMYVGGDYSFFDDPLYSSVAPAMVIDTEDASHWASKFKTLRGRSPSSNSLTTFCTQAANRLPWSTNASPRKKTSFTTRDDQPTNPGLISCSSSTTSSSTLPRRRSSTRTSHCSTHSSQPIPSLSTSTSTTASTTTTVRTMKLKVIYDVDNIVVIQIPRSTNLAALRTRLHDKFSTLLDASLKPLADQFVLLYNENARTDTTCAITLISSEHQWASVMKTWDRLEKVTLRCIH